MIYQNFNIDNYAWNVQICYDVGEKNLDKVIKLLRHFYFSDKINKACIDSIVANKENTGITCTNMLSKKTLIVINRCSSKEELINTICHEIRHLESHIATYYNLDEKGEEVCYLIGDIAEEMYYVFKWIL